MAYWSEVKLIVQPFPCLWDPQDPYFSDETVKAVCREQILEICNQRSDLPIDMESLKQWLSDNLAQSTTQLQTAAEQLPLTALPQSVTGEAGGNKAQEITAAENLDQSVLGRDGANMAIKHTAATENLTITAPLIYQYVPSQVDESLTGDLVAIERSSPVSSRPLPVPPQRKAIEKSSPVSSRPLPVPPQRKAIERSSPVSSRPLPVPPQRKPRLQDLLKEFPCLSDPNDLNYTDNNIRRRYRQQLLERFNSLSSIQITMSDLIRKMTSLRKLQERRSKLKSLDSGHLKKLATQQGRERRNNPRLQDLLKEFPCLSDPNDLNYTDNNIRRRYRQQLLERFNSLSSIQITMSDLIRKMTVLRKLQERRSKLKSLDSGDLKKLATQQGRERRNNPRLQDLMKEFPCLWDPTDLNHSDNTMRARSRQQLLEKFNSLSTIQITMSDLKRKLDNLRKKDYRYEPKLQDLLKEFPCLWDPNDSNFMDETIKEQSQQQLLEKFNSLSSVKISMSDLNRQLSVLSVRQKPVLKPKLQDLFKDFPCLWDPNDLNYSDVTLKAHIRQQLLEKFNNLSTVQITMSDLKRKLKSLRGHRQRSDKPKFKGMGQPPLSTEKQGAASVQEKEFQGSEKVQDISFGLVQPGKEREANEITTKTIKAVVNNTPQIIPGTSLDSTEPSCRPQDAPDRGGLRRKLATSHRGRKRRNKAANRQTTVQGICDGHLEATEGEREVQEITADIFRALFDKSQTDPKASIVSTEPNQRPQDDPIQEALVLRGIEVIFDYCRFCGELKDCTESRKNPKPYLDNKKCTLIVNDIRAELEFADDSPRNVCRDCDRKFQEMLDFVKSVKDAQVKFNHFNNETLYRKRKNDDTESEKEADEQQKKCRITIDLNSDTLPSLFDNGDENNDVEMDFDDEIGTFFVNVNSKQRNKSVSINISPPSLSLCNDNDKNMNSSNSHDYRVETPAKYITTYTDFENNIPLTDKIVPKPLSCKMLHISTKDVCEGDVNSINIKKEDETADDINDKKEQLNADDNIHDEIDIKEEDIEAAIAAARKKSQKIIVL